MERLASRFARGANSALVQHHAGAANATTLPGSVMFGRNITESANQSHVAMTNRASVNPAPSHSMKQWPGAKILNNPSMQIIARRYQRTPLQVWQRYQVQCGLPGSNTGSDEHRSSINSFALTLEEMNKVTVAQFPQVPA
ncbi:uncharacterized protein LOC135806643 [Sycon ciliatum]|uniref:uncharacterized protein LOC135806643 n=1 Tax=Sycon ciliatum TaxID=27933 RepID=UPI0031F66DBF